MGIEKIPINIPRQWSAEWFRSFIYEVLAKLDARNAVGNGVEITSDGNSVATFNTGDEIDAKVLVHNTDADSHTAAFTQHNADADANTAAFTQHTELTTDVHAAADYAQTDVAETITQVWSFDDSIVLPKTSGKGIKVESADPSWGWRDIIGTPQEPVSGGGKPTWTQIATSGIYTWNFATNDYQSYTWHLPHDYVQGSAIHFHAHYFGSQTSGNSARFTFSYIYAKGHNQAAFPTTASSSFAQLAQSTTAYQHMIAESDAVTIPGLEVDGLIICKVTRVAPTGGPSDITGGIFVPVVDIHYQSTNMATKQKSPDFWT